MLWNIRKVVPKLIIKYEGYGEPIEFLTLTIVTVWNNGLETISRGDVVKAHPIAIRIDGEGVIFKARIVKVTRNVNDVEVQLSKDRKKLTIFLNFPDWKDGAVIQVEHSGKNGNSDLVEEGTIKGCKDFKRVNGTITPYIANYNSITRILFLILVSLSIITVRVLEAEMSLEMDSWSWITTSLVIATTMANLSFLIYRYSISAPRKLWYVPSVPDKSSATTSPSPVVSETLSTPTRPKP